VTETLFGTEVPVNQNNDNTPYTLGTRFSPLVIGQVTHLKFYRADNGPDGLVELILWQNSDQSQLASVEVLGSGLSPGWNEVALTSPVSLTVGEFYIASYYTPDWYVSTAPYSWPKTSTDGNLETPAPAGFFNGNFEPSYPDSGFNNGCYFADVVFEPSGVDPAEGSAALGLNLAAAATGGADAEGSAALGLGLTVAASGGADADGAAAIGLGLAVAAAGARRAQGAVALGLGLNLAAAGARDSLGSVALGLDLSVSSSGVHASAGASALSLNFALAAQGSDGQAGRPVTPWPYGAREVSGYPWTPRPVKSFSGEVG
jgi:Domain of unknown function (DUF4082)